MALMIDQEDTVQLVGFRLGPKLFGTDILKVREILREPQIAPLDGGPAFIEGVLRLRSQVLPVIDLRKMLGSGSAPPDRERIWVLVAPSGKRAIAYIVDSITPIIRIKKAAILPAPDIILSGLRSNYIKGVCETDKGLILIVELEQMLSDDEAGAVGRLPLA